MFLLPDNINNTAINKGDGDSIISQAHFDLMTIPQPFLLNLPYGAEIKKSRMNTSNAKLKISMSE